jgi:pimeloyl-ACP methyl ester carboxylesterase
MKIIGKWLVAIILILASFLGTTYIWQVQDYTFNQTETFANFDEYYNRELQISKAEGTRPDNEEKLVRYSAEKTPIAILYLHGFGASRMEGEEIVNQVADTFQSNLYYVRLPGHGTNVEDQKNTPFPKYLQDAETALIMASELGDKVVLIGTSMGGLISTYLAAKHPDKVSAVILASPFYEFPDPTANLLKFTWGKSLIHIIMGEIRKSNEQDVKNESYKYWYKDQYFDALQNLMDLKRFIEKENSLSKIEDPVLLFYFFKSDAIQDRSASVKAMLAAFEKIKSSPNYRQESKAVKIEEGDHVLLSKFAKVNKPLLYKEMVDFITATTGAEPNKSNLKKAKR